MNDIVTVDFNLPIPVFPLEETVLLPHTALPLHIFEPRYRTMVDDALNSFGLVAMAVFNGTVSEDEYLHGSPPLRPCVCVGHIQHYEPLDGGRYLLLLLGLCRARIKVEIPHDPYRTFRLDPLEPPTEEDGLEEDIQVIRELAAHPALDGLLDAVKPSDRPDARIPNMTVLDVLIGEVCANVEERYRMLADADAKSRAAWLIGRMRKMAGK